VVRVPIVHLEGDSVAGKAKKAKTTTEAEIHFELYYHFRKLFDSPLSIAGTDFGVVKPEEPISSGFADLVVFDTHGNPWCVIEAKRYEKGKINRNIDPNSLVVIKQALNYATLLGAPYFVTYNGKAATLFRTAEKFVSLPERKGKPYDLSPADLVQFPKRLLDDIFALESGATEWAGVDERFLARLRTLHEHTASEVAAVLKKHLKGKFQKEYVSWLELQGWEEGDATNLLFANQAAYLWIGRILFYEVLARKYKGVLPRLKATKDLAKFPAMLQSFFAKVLAIDYKAVFQLDPIFDLIPMEENVCEALNSFVDEITQYDLASITSDVIGRVYERLIPPQERHSLGQYYTPPKIVQLICTHAIRKVDDLVLDPACGSGGFLIGAYDRLKGMGSAKKHEVLLKQLFGIDINRFPAHLAVINLAMRDLASTTDDVKVFVGDFFDVFPKEQFALELGDVLGATKSTPGDYLVSTPEGLVRRHSETFIPASFDAVVANPPYIRQESLDKPKVRAHLKSLGIREFNQRADIYVYFFTHATQFLKAGGRLGFITSHHWLSAEYGEDLAKFLLDRYKINAVVAFEKQAFDEPLVNTCITFATHHPDQAVKEVHQAKKDAKVISYGTPEERDANPVAFLRIKEPMEIAEIVSVLNEGHPAETRIDSDRFWLYVKAQKKLGEDLRWKKYLLAPVLYFDLVQLPTFAKFEELAEAVFGLKSGANDFFYLSDEDAKAFRLPKSFLRKLIKGVGQSPHIVFRREDTDWNVLDLHAEVEAALTPLKGVSDRKRLRKAAMKRLEEKNHGGLIDYIVAAEKEGIDERESVVARRVWFDLGELPTPVLAVPKEYWRVPVVYWNVDGLVTDQQFYPVNPKDGVDAEILCAILNSDLFTLMREVDGREAAGEAMTRNRLTTAELNSIALPDPRRLAPNSVEEIREAFRALIGVERTASEAEVLSLKRAVTRSVLKAIGAGGRQAELEQAVAGLLDLRIKTGAYQKGGPALIE
jgi:type I restriction-modification system DNA methylase subunit